MTKKTPPTPKKDPTPNEGLLMMLGSEGNLDYLVVGRNGPFALGLKPNQVMPGAKFNMPGMTWFGARIRSAPAGEMFKMADAIDAADGGNVVALKKKPENHTEAWPTITWEKNSEKRASTQIGVWLEGDFDSLEKGQPLLEKLKNREIAEQMANYIAELIGEDQLFLSPKRIASWLQATIYAPMAKKVEKMLELATAVQSEMKATAGQFGMQAAMVKKAYNGIAETPVDDIKDIPSPDDDAFLD